MDKEFLNKKQKIMIIIVIIFIVILLILSLTYAYFLTQIKGNKNNTSINVTTANLVLEYGDGNGIVELYNIKPGTTATKTFIVTNKGNEKVLDYVVVLEKIINNY